MRRVAGAVWGCLLWLAAAAAVPMAAQSGAQSVAQAGARAGDALDDVLQQAQGAQAAAHYAEAAAAYSRATKLEPRLPELWANRGLMEHLAGQRQAAIDSFRHALALKPALFTPLLFSGVDYLALGKPELAMPFLDRALTQQPKNPDAVMAAAQAHAALKQGRRALTLYQAASDLQPANASAWYGLATVALQAIEDDGGTLARRYGDSPWARALYADELLTQGRVTEATRLYKEAAAAADAETRARFLQMLEAAIQGSWVQVTPEAGASLRDAIGADPRLAPCGASDRTAKGPPADAGCAFLAGDYALSAERAGLAASAEALYWSVKANERRAVLALSRFEELSPQSPATFDLTGDLYRRRSLEEKARAEYARALAIDPHDPAALLGTAAAWLAESHPEQALATAQQGLTDRPDDPKLNLIAGQAMVEQHQFVPAKPYLQKSLAASAGQTGGVEAVAFAHALLGRVAVAEGNTDAAIRELRLGLSSDRDGSLYYQLYRLLRKTGDVAGADAAEAQIRRLKAQRFANAAIALQNAQEQQPE